MSELQRAISRYVAAETPQTAPDFEAVRGIARRRALRRTAAVSVGVAATLTAAATLVNAQLDGGGAPLVTTAGPTAVPPASGSTQPTADVTRFPSRSPDVDAQRVLDVVPCGVYDYSPFDSPTDLADLPEIELVVSGRVLGFAEGPIYHAETIHDVQASPTVVMRVHVENVMKGEAPSSGIVYVALVRCVSLEAYSAALPADTQVGLYLDAAPVEDGSFTMGNEAAGRPAGEPLWQVGPQAFIVADGDDGGVVFPLWRKVMPQAKFEDQLPSGNSSQVTSNAVPPSVGSQREVMVYFLTGARFRDGETVKPPDRLIAETVTTEDTGDPGLDAVRALLTTRPTDPDDGNGYDLLTIDPAPITGVNSVTVGDGIINVDLTKDVWDPYPAIKCFCPSGEIITQQLVWTVQTVLESDDPVSVTVNGEPARGIWMEPLNGPVYADPDALERAPAS